jgi:hypothetical protein
MNYTKLAIINLLLGSSALILSMLWDQMQIYLVIFILGILFINTLSLFWRPQEKDLVSNSKSLKDDEKEAVMDDLNKEFERRKKEDFLIRN